MKYVIHAKLLRIDLYSVGLIELPCFGSGGFILHNFHTECAVQGIYIFAAFVTDELDTIYNSENIVLRVIIIH